MTPSVIVLMSGVDLEVAVGKRWDRDLRRKGTEGAKDRPAKFVIFNVDIQDKVITMLRSTTGVKSYHRHAFGSNCRIVVNRFGRRPLLI